MDNLLYDFRDNSEAEQYNTLVLLDSVIGKKNLNVKPTFHVLGGTALIFHGVLYTSTIDIDTANALTQEVKDIVEPFISDNASEVALLAKNYTKRLVPYKPEIFKNCEVLLLSLEDVIITKLGAYRLKDKEDITATNVLDLLDVTKMEEILSEEFDTKTAELIRGRFKTVAGGR